MFVVPIILLGMMLRFAFRLSITIPEEAGEVSGRVYAISTLGSFIGTFLPVLLFIPLVGTTNTFLIFGFFLMTVALVGLSLSIGLRKAIKWIWLPIILAILAVVLAGSGLKNTPDQVYETESSYNYIEVLQRDGYTLLRLNEGQGVHSMYHPDVLNYSGPWMQHLAGPFFNQPPFSPEDVQSIAIIGLAAGTTARQATEVFGPIPIDGFEIDPKIITVGQDYFGMTMPNLNALAQDGRWGLSKSDMKYTIISIDAYRPPYIPWHLTTKEFFEITREHLTENGVLAINVGRAPNDRRLIDALVTTLLTVYPSVHIMDIPGTFNSMVYATNQPTTFDYLAINLSGLAARGDVHPLLLDSISRVLSYRQLVPEPTIVLTDDRAPVEWIVNMMVLNFIISSEFEDLQ